MPERSFGRTVRYRRTKIGLSQAKLGDLVGRSASTVRSWERDASTPSDNEVIDALAAVLAIDPRILYEKAGMAVPDVETSPTVEQALASLRPETPPEKLAQDPEDFFELVPEPLPVARADPVVTPPPPRATPAPYQPPEPGFRSPRHGLVMNPATPPLTEPSYIEDDSQKQLYRVRNLATVVLLVALVIVLIWAAANAFGALGDWWDEFLSELRI
jgi:transcriptional regulator with XRE-family HTH domain